MISMISMIINISRMSSIMIMFIMTISIIIISSSIIIIIIIVMLIYVCLSRAISPARLMLINLQVLSAGYECLGTCETYKQYVIACAEPNTR